LRNSFRNSFRKINGTLLRNSYRATIVHMTDDVLQRLADTARAYQRAKKAFDAAKDAALTVELEALKDGHKVPDVARISPFTYAHVRQVAEANGIPRDERKARYPRRDDAG
jgi:hypothetical protein